MSPNVLTDYDHLTIHLDVTTRRILYKTSILPLKRPIYKLHITYKSSTKSRFTQAIKANYVYSTS